MIKIIKSSEDVLNLVQPYIPSNPTIIEGGAFTGHDTIRMAQFWPNSIIHAFEPVPDIFEQLQKNCVPFANIHCHQQALSNTTGTAMLYRSEKPKKPGISTQASSLLKPKERLNLSAIIFPETITVATISIDDWAAQHQIDQVDFLWLDLQGYELPVLKAAGNILQTTKAIYCEVQFVESYENNPLYPETRQWLESQGLIMIARDFEEDQTKSFFGNILMVRKG